MAFMSSTDPQMIHDLSLLHWDENELFYEYLEMGKMATATGIEIIFHYSCLLAHLYIPEVIQFGFVAIFVSGYPLAPLFALLNNIFEIRGDGTKLLWFYRRPVNRRAVGIGVWLKIMETIGKFSVLTSV